jgi:hypothetical protein
MVDQGTHSFSVLFLAAYLEYSCTLLRKWTIDNCSLEGKRPISSMCPSSRQGARFAFIAWEKSGGPSVVFTTVSV